ncbi:MAG: hypothetical protein AAGB26_17830 [Planctomycetota bacterium]
MRRWKLVTVLVLGVLWLLACEQRAERSVEGVVEADSPVAGVWYLQSEGEGRPVAGDLDVRFEFLGQGRATYERSQGGPEGPMAFELRYNLLDQIISIDSNRDDPAVPRLTGRIDVSDDGKTLRIRTHSDAVWVLTRDARPGGELEAARAVVESDADPMLIRVQHLAYAVSRYRQTFGTEPGHLSDLVDAGLVSTAALTETGQRDELPARYPRMTAKERANWLDGHSAFVLLGRPSGDTEAEHVVVATLPADHKAAVIIGMSSGAVYETPGKEAAALILQQEGSLPERWPGLGWSEDAATGLEPLSD